MELEKKFERIFSLAMKKAAHGAWVSSDVGFGESNNGPHASVPQQFSEIGTKSGQDEGKIPFDWASTYTLRLDFVPETHITSSSRIQSAAGGKGSKDAASHSRMYKCYEWARSSRRHGFAGH